MDGQKALQYGGPWGVDATHVSIVRDRKTASLGRVQGGGNQREFAVEEGVFGPVAMNEQSTPKIKYGHEQTRLLDQEGGLVFSLLVSPNRGTRLQV